MSKLDEVATRIYENLKGETTLNERDRIMILESVKSMILGDVAEEKQNLYAMLEFVNAIESEFNPKVTELQPLKEVEVRTWKNI